MRLSIPKRKNHAKHFPTVCTSTGFSIFLNLKFKNPISLHDKEQQLFFAFINTWPSKDSFLKVTLQGRQIAVTSHPFFWFIKERIQNFTLSRKHFFYLLTEVLWWKFIAVQQDGRYIIQIKFYWGIIFTRSILKFLIEEEFGKRFYP